MCVDGAKIVQLVKKWEIDFENVIMDFHDEFDTGQVKRLRTDVKATLGRLRIRQ
jgi:hypothetical protein